MSKCRIIDRIALTKGILKFKDDSQSHDLKKHDNIHGEICPECGQRSLFPEAGCWSCKSCAYSKCDIRRIEND